MGYYRTAFNSEFPGEFYRFLANDFFFERKNKHISEVLENKTPHYIWTSPEGTFSHDIRHVGKKTETVMRQIMQAEKSGNFCECGEPILNWYEFCPVCGQKVEKERN